MTNEKIVLEIRKLNNLRRSNDMPVATYNVAQHSYHVAMLAMMIADDLFQRGEIDGYDSDILFRKALLHDVGESIVGDILYPVKNALGVMVDIIENDGLKKLFEGSMFQDYSDYAIGCKEGLEGQIVNLADMADYYLNMWEECMRGNRFVESKMMVGRELLYGLPLFEKSKFLKDVVGATSSGYNDLDNIL